MNNLDPRDARALLDDTEREARGAVQPRMDLLFAVWGVAWLVGYLAMWLSTVDQEPYRGPAPRAFLIVGAGLLAAGAVTAVLIARATAGISGPVDRAGTYYGLTWPVAFLTWPVAFLTWGVVLAAVQDAGIRDAAAGLLGASMPALLVAVIYCASSAALEEPAMFCVGLAVAVVAAVCEWTGPSTITLVVGVGGASAFAAGTLASHRTGTSA